MQVVLRLCERLAKRADKHYGNRGSWITHGHRVHMFRPPGTMLPRLVLLNSLLVAHWIMH